MLFYVFAMKKKYFVFIVFLFSLVCSLQSQSSDELWSPSTATSKKESNKLNKNLEPKEYKVFNLNLELLKSKLNTSPKRNAKSKRSGVIISFPNELGELHKYEVFEASIMDENLQNKYKEINSYIGYDVSNKANIVRFSLSSIGLHAFVLSVENKIRISPFSNDILLYKVFSNNNANPNEAILCETEDLIIERVFNKTSIKKRNSLLPNGEIRVFKLAVTATDEYSEYHLDRLGVSSNSSKEYKKKKILEVIAATVTGVNAVLERDLSIKLKLIDESENIIFLENDSDGLNNDDIYGLLNGNGSIVNSLVGLENYDIGHVFTKATGFSGGLASVWSVCTEDKSSGVSGLLKPFGADFEELVLHEIGHQFGARHTFNSDIDGCRNARSDGSAVEPGSGSTIMSYAGVCIPQQIQSTTDLYYHYNSIKQIWSYISGISCGMVEEIENTSPIIEPLNDYYVPILTPFELNAQVSDNEGDEMTFNWEQINGENTIVPPVSSSTLGASFRSYPPSSDSNRFFPNKTIVNSGETSSQWEVLPSVPRTMNFGLSVRDNSIKGSQISIDELQVNFVENSAPFVVTSQNENIEWKTGEIHKIKWNVSNSNKEPINCEKVQILLSEDGGESFPIVLISETLNDGEAEITVPNISSEGVKIKVKSISNIFYSVNKGYIRVNPNPNLTFVPDDNFERKLIQLGYDSELDNYVKTEIIEEVLNLNLSNLNIFNLKGIEDFKNLLSLDCSNNNLTKINLTSNTRLNKIDLSFNTIDHLDISKNTELKELIIKSNRIKNIDLKANIKLEKIDISSLGEGYNELSSLDISKNLNLNYLNFSFNKIQSINVRSNTLLKTLIGSYNSLENLNLDKNVGIEVIDLDDNEIENLNISMLSKLKLINIQNNNLKSLDISKNLLLTYLKAQLNDLSEFDVSKNGKLFFLDIQNNNIVCIKVNETQLLNIPNNWIKDYNTSYSVNCDSFDLDIDGVADNLDLCPETPLGVIVNEQGCSTSQWDADNDGVALDKDLCPNTNLNEPVNSSGCSLKPTMIFGTMSNDGSDPNSQGIFYKFNTQTKEKSIIIETKINQGRSPYGGMIQATNSRFYGLTSDGGQARAGVLYEYDPIIDKYLVLKHFNYDIGYNPVGNLIQASNGRLYGLTTGGLNRRGVIFEFIIESRQFNIIHNFEEAGTRGSLMQASNGNLYGITSYGGESNDGTLFEYNLLNKIYTKKVEFLENETSSYPYFNLVEGVNKKLYGAAMFGGPFCDGSLFEFNPLTDEFVIKYRFELQSEGALPNTVLTLANNNKIYGITLLGGKNDKGVIFEYDYLKNRYRKKIDLDSYVNYSGVKGGLLQSINGKFYFTNGRNSSNTFDAKLYEYDLISNSIETHNISSFGIHPGMTLAEWVVEEGNLEEDDDKDGVINSFDNCYYTPFKEQVDENGCSSSQLVFIPDENFENALIELGIDSDNEVNQKVKKSDVDEVVYLNIPGKNIKDLTGIQAFKNIKTLYCYSNNLMPNIDLSANSKLINLYVYNNPDLQCIQVSDESSANLGNGIYANWIKNSFTNYSEDCSSLDIDGDTILNEEDNCPDTANTNQEDLDEDGIGDVCDDDIDGDGVLNDTDLCPESPEGETVNENGCSQSQLDDDNDGVMNDKDLCPDTPTEETVNENGCSQSQLDDDNDGVMNDKDICPETPTSETVNENGCSQSQLDDDNDGVMNDKDVCPETPTSETVNENGCSQSQLDDDNDGVMNDKDLCPETPTSETVNENGCSQSQIDNDNDSVMNDKDLCPETPEGETVDENGCSQSQLDDDSDGIMNNIDLCPETPEGETVNFDGCIVFSSDNFNIETINETCPNKNNGQINITATKTYNYIVTVNGSEYNLTNNLSIKNLQPGPYDICITVPNVTTKQCYTVEITKGKTVSGKASTTANKTSVEIEKGTAPFDVIINGQLLYKTMSSTFELDIKHGDLIEVKTAVSCEGVFSKTINLFEEIVVFPNPTTGIFEIALPLSLKEVKIELFTISSQLISSHIYQVINGKVQLDIRNNPNAVYLIKVYLENPVSVKIIKK